MLRQRAAGTDRHGSVSAVFLELRSMFPRELLANEHAIAVAVETIGVAHRVFVGVEDAFCAGERGDEYEKARLWQMKICEELIDDAEIVTRIHEEGGFGAARLNDLRWNVLRGGFGGGVF
jgi:hypothetical protein